MEGGRQSDIPCPKCGHPTSEIVGIKAAYRVGALDAPPEAVHFKHRCLDLDCGHSFERAEESNNSA
jgi:hypothetical protein